MHPRRTPSYPRPAPRPPPASRSSHGSATCDAGCVQHPPRPDVALVERLAAAGCVAAHEEATELTAAAPRRGVPEEWIARRERGEPLQWIVGSTEFCGRRLRIDTGVYVPRFHTEALARQAAARLPAGGVAAGLCTGSGVVAAHLSAVVPGAIVVGVDLSLTAVRCARRNGVAAVQGDLAGPLRPGVFDVVTAVAPDVPTNQMHLLPAEVQRYEPNLALDGGADALDLVRRVVTAAHRLLRPDGWLLVEVGGDQAELLTTSLADHGFVEVDTWADEEGDLRGLSARHSGRGDIRPIERAGGMR